MYVLRVVNGPAAGSELELDGETLVGREGAHVNLADPELSARHAALHPTTWGVVIEDLGSTSGTYVDGERIHEPTLITGDATVVLGSTELSLLFPADGADSAYAARVTPDRQATRMTATIPEPAAQVAATEAAPAAPAPEGRPTRRTWLTVAAVVAVVVVGAVVAAVLLTPGGSTSHTVDLRGVARIIGQVGQPGGIDSSVVAVAQVAGPPGGDGAAVLHIAIGQGGAVQGTVQYFFAKGSYTTTFTGQARPVSGGAFRLAATEKVTASGGDFAGASGSPSLTSIIRPGSPNVTFHSTGTIDY